MKVRGARGAFAVFAVVEICGCVAVSAAAQAPQEPPSKKSSSSTPSSDFIRVSAVEPLPPPIAAAVDALRAPAVAAHIGFLASPPLEGRGLASRGLDAAAEYVAAQLALAGVPPLPDQTYFQPVPLREISAASGAVDFQWRRGDDVIDRRTFFSGTDCLVPQIPARSVTGALVFAGYGIRETVPERDDYRGLDVKGKIVVMLAGLPEGAAWRTPRIAERWGGEDAEERHTEKRELARRMGALAVLVVEGADWATRILPKNKPEERTFWRLEDDGLDDKGLFLARVSPAVGAALLAGGGAAERAVPRALPGVTATLRTSGRESALVSRNVVAYLAGSDPGLAKDAVVLGAHLDHLGIVDGAIHPGADDNASGVAALLEIARVLAASRERPKRSFVFAFWTGEEEGKLGSGHWVRHPLWPLARTAVYLNLDMIGHPWVLAEIRKLVADSSLAGGDRFLEGLKPADFVEPGVASFAPDLGPVLERAALGTGLALHLDWTPGVYGGSDYRDFARARVPFVRFFGNFFPAYHERGDTPSGVDAIQVLKTARLTLATAWLLADR